MFWGIAVNGAKPVGSLVHLLSLHDKEYKNMIKHEEYIKETYQLANSAQEKGNHPFGALLVIDNLSVNFQSNISNTIRYLNTFRLKFEKIP